MLKNQRLYFVYLFVARAGLTYVSMVLFTIVATNVSSGLQKLYLHVVLYQRLEYHEMILSSGKVSLALSTHSNTIRSGLAEKFGLSLKSASTVIAAFVVAFTSEWKLAIVTATIIPVAVLAIGITAVFDEKKEQALNATKADAATVAEEVVSSMRTVRSLGAEEKLLAKYHQLLEKASKIGWQRLPITGIQIGSYMFAIYGGYALAFWYGVQLYAKHEARSSGTIITTLFSIMIGVHSFSELAGHLGHFMRIGTAGAEMFKVIDSASTESGAATSPVVASEKETASEEKGPNIFHEDIIFQDVSFHYPTRPGVPALDGFSLIIPCGKKTALVGPSGSGKSTVVGLLLRWYDINSGALRIGVEEIGNVPFKSLRANIGLVQQVRAAE